MQSSETIVQKMSDRGHSFKNRSSKFPVVIAMYTPDRLGSALRLKQSLLRLNLSFMICEIDSVHSTTSMSGNRDSAFAKPRFIRHWLEKLKAPVLYVDADMIFVSFPTEIFKAQREGCQFAIFNWLSEEDNQTYLPASRVARHKQTAGVSEDDNAYVKGFVVDHISSDQIIVSGAVQYWGYSLDALSLLDLWTSTIDANPRSRDDHCLDFAFNNFPDRAKLRFRSLPRAYCRVAWWPHITPVIDHPDLPALNMPWEPLAPEYLSKRIHPYLLRPRNPTPQSSNSPSA
jgi:hypothetical protein